MNAPLEHISTHSQEGVAWVYLGSPGGVSPEPFWCEGGGQNAAYFGGAVAGGDINGDGYGDVLIGALGYDNPEEYEGRAFSYRGPTLGDSFIRPVRAPADTRLKLVCPGLYTPGASISGAVLARADAELDPLLAVYDVSGRLVTNLVQGPRGTASFYTMWNGRNAAGRSMPPGTYFIRLGAGPEAVTRKLLLVR